MSARKPKRKAPHDEEEALRLVMADLEEEHSAAPRVQHVAPGRSTVHHEHGAADLDTGMRARRAQREREAVPEGFAFDAASGFYYSTEAGFYYERTPTRELYCEASTGVWTYFDSIASEWRPYPTELLTPAESALSYARAAAAAASECERAASFIAENVETPPALVSAPKPEEALPEAAAPAMTLPDLAVRTAVAVKFNTGKKARSNVVAAAPAAAAAAVEAPSAARDNVSSHVDWAALICSLCQRQFGSAETLQRHVSFSRLHQENLAAAVLVPVGGSGNANAGEGVT